MSVVCQLHTYLKDSWEWNCILSCEWGYMKASELKQIIENMISQYGDLEIVFRNEYKNNIYDIKDVMINFSRNEDDKYIITNHYY